MSDCARNLERARQYLRAIETGADAVSFFAPDAAARWYPHKLAPKGMTADLAAMREAS
jgi:hypothetical protein